MVFGEDIAAYISSSQRHSSSSQRPSSYAILEESVDHHLVHYSIWKIWLGSVNAGFQILCGSADGIIKCTNQKVYPSWINQALLELVEY